MTQYAMGWRELKTRAEKNKSFLVRLFTKKTPLMVVRSVRRSRAAAQLAQASC